MGTHDGDISTDGMGEVEQASAVAAMTDAPKGWQCVDSRHQALPAEMMVRVSGTATEPLAKGTYAGSSPAAPFISPLRSPRATFDPHQATRAGLFLS